jgi:hypothetical protein
MASTPPAPDTVTVTVVHSPACHFCDDARAVLTDLATEFPLTIEYLDCTEPRGAALIRKHRAGMYPLVLLDGAFLSAGRLPRKKLRAQLTSRFAAVA